MRLTTKGRFAVTAMVYDVRTRGKIHHAYFWGYGAICVVFLLMRPIAFSAPMLALTQRLMG